MPTLLAVTCTLFSLISALISIHGYELFSAAFYNTLQSSYEIKVPETWGHLFIALSALGIIALVFSATLLACAVLKQKMKSRHSVLIMSILAVVLLIVSSTLIIPKSQWLQSQLSLAESDLPSDYISDKWFQELSLSDLEQCFDKETSDSEDYPIYIGRSDCAQCKSFENKLGKILSEDDVSSEMPSYYTSQDRDGPRGSEMYDLLGKMGVTSVPCLLVVKNGKILYRWDSPEEHISQIRRYLRTGKLPSN